MKKGMVKMSLFKVISPTEEISLIKRVKLYPGKGILNAISGKLFSMPFFAGTSLYEKYGCEFDDEDLDILDNGKLSLSVEDISRFDIVNVDFPKKECRILMRMTANLFDEKDHEYEIDSDSKGKFIKFGVYTSDDELKSKVFSYLRKRLPECEGDIEIEPIKINIKRLRKKPLDIKFSGKLYLPESCWEDVDEPEKASEVSFIKE